MRIQLKGAAYDFEFPYIMVNVNEKGKVSAEEWKYFRQSNKQNSNESHIIWLTQQMDVEGFGTVELVNGWMRIPGELWLE